MPLDLDRFEVLDAPAGDSGRFAVLDPASEAAGKQAAQFAASGSLRQIFDSIGQPTVLTEEQQKAAKKKELERALTAARINATFNVDPETGAPYQGAAIASDVEKAPGKIMTQAGRLAVGNLADVGAFYTGDKSFANTEQVLKEGALADRFEPLPTEQERRFLPKPLQAVEAGAQGLVQMAPQLAATVLAPHSAPIVFGMTPEGFDPKQAAFAAALPFVGKYSGEIAGIVAKKLGVTSEQALNLVRAAGAGTGATSPILADQELQIRQQLNAGEITPEQAERARIDGFGNAIAMGVLGMTGARFEKGGEQPPSSDKIPVVWREIQKGAPDASQVKEAAKVYGNVQPRKPSPGELPKPKSGAGVQPQAEGRVPEAKKGEVSLTPEEQAAAKAELEALGEGTAPESDTVRLYRGHDGSPGGVYYTEDKTYASQQGPEMEYLDVPRSELSKYGVQQVEGSGTPKAYKLPPEMTKEAKPVEKPPTQPVYDLEAETPKPKAQIVNPEAVSDMSPSQFVNALKENGKQPTQAAYELGKTIASPEQRARIAELNSKAAEESKKAVSKIAEAKTDAERSKAFSDAQDANAKKQYFNEAGRLYDAIQEANKTGDRAAAAKKFGVDEKAMPEAQKPAKPSEKPARKAFGLTQTPKPTGESDQGELIPVGDLGPSMGAMTPSDPLELASKESGNPDVYGIAQRVREERSKSGQVESVPTGQGTNAPDSIDRGRMLLNQGADAQRILSDFERTKKLSSDDMAIVRAEGERLAQEARLAEEQFGTASLEYQSAFQRLSEWDRRTKPMQTEWHKTGMAQQGETDLDTGSFTGLQRAFTDATGKTFTPKQADGARKQSKQVRTAETEASDANSKLAESIQTDIAAISASERAARKAVWRTLREKAAREAKEETKQRVLDLQRRIDTANEQIKAAQAAEKAVNKTLRESAVRSAREESKARIEQAKRDKSIAEVQLKAAQAAEKAVAKQKIRDALRQARQSRKDAASPEQVVWSKVQEYIESDPSNANISFDELRTKVATDLGMTVKQVTSLLLRSKRTKFLADEAWRKQTALRETKARARRWLRNQQIPGWDKAIAAIPRTMFSLKVGFHGTVALGTHAPMVAFQPKFWGEYAKNFVRMYRMIGSPAYYEMQVQELLRNPNHTLARRSGLVNDPFQYEDFTTPELKGVIGRMSGMGNRGYAVLKFIRQDMFDHLWSQLPKTAQNSEVAKALADGINHATGVTKSAPPKGSNVVLFAPRLLMSRAAWLAVDPIKAGKTMVNWKNATEGEKRFAVQQVQEKAWVVGTMTAMLAINQGMLALTGSKQKVNMTDPTRSDFLKFKIAGMNFSYGNPMLTMARLPIRMYQIRSSDGGKTRNLVYPDETTYGALGTYARSQMSPFASLASSLWFRSDYQNRPLPGSTREVPKRLRAEGFGPYSWKEFWSEQFLPIPFEEAAREVWHAIGMNSADAATARKALSTIAIMGATGARLNDDVETPTIRQKAAQFQNTTQPTTQGSSQAVIDYMMNGHESQVRRELESLLKTKTPSQVYDGIRQAATKTMTGSQLSDRKFFSTLSEEEKSQYREERAKQGEAARKSISLLREILSERKKRENFSAVK